jgi:hypothetical protein
MAKDLFVSLADRPGELATLGEALGNAGVNIEGGCAIVHEGRGLVHLLVEDAAAARTALERAGVNVETETDVVIAGAEADQDTPGSLGRMARAVADAGINLTFVYEASHERFVFGAEDADGARRALGV